MSEFAKAPWKYETTEYDPVNGTWYRIADEQGLLIAVCMHSEANARLIAAAPEMYKLLKDCVRVERPGNYIPAFLELKDKARELLARIDGEKHEELHEVEAQE